MRCVVVCNRRSGGRKIWFPEIRKPRPVDHQLPLTPPQNCRVHMHSHTPRRSPARSIGPERAPVCLPISGGAVGRSITRVLSLGILYIILCLYTYTMDRQNPPKPWGHNFTVISFSVWLCICAVATARASCV